MHPKHRQVRPEHYTGDESNSTEGLREQAERGESIAANCGDCERETVGMLSVEGGDIEWRCSDCGALHNLSWLDPY